MGVPAPPPARDGEHADSVFLKQNGQIYMVRDWDTMRRWIVEKRVDRHDLVSEGGVRWEPIGTRPDLMPLFSGAKRTPSHSLPFGGETPFGASTAESGWHDDDTEGVPVGLPPLPTEEAADTVPGTQRTWDPSQTPPPPALFETPRPSHSRAMPALVVDDGLTDGLSKDQDSDAGHGNVGDEEVTERVTERVSAAPKPLPTPVPSKPPFQSKKAPSSVPSSSSHKPTATDGSWDDLTAVEAPTSHATSTSSGSPNYPLDDVTFDEEWDATYNPPSDRSGVLWGIAVACTLAVVVVLGWVWWTMRTPTSPNTTVAAPPVEAPVTPPVPTASPVAPRPVPALSTPPPAPLPTPPAAPAAAQPPAPVIPVVTPEPPAPPPDPRPEPAPQGKSAEATSQRAWNIAESDPAGAASMFREALGTEPNHWDSLYGLGYVLLKLGDPSAATPYLCQCRDAPSADIRQDVTGMLNARGLSCG